MDIIIFSGQSNMQGQTEGLPENNEAVCGAWEYRVLSDTLLPLKNPVGEDVSTERHLLAAHEGGGSLVPAFCRAYVNVTGREVVAVHAARGATTIGEWLRGTQRYCTLVQKCNRAIEKARKLGEVERIYFVWLQGESDSIIATSEEEYLQRLIAFKNDLKRDVGIREFGIIKVGYFFSTVSRTDPATHVEDVERDEAIMRAQERAVAQDKDFLMLTRVCTQLSLHPERLNPKARGHYNNASMEIIGTQAGEALAKCRNT